MFLVYNHGIPFAEIHIILKRYRMPTYRTKEIVISHSCSPYVGPDLLNLFELRTFFKRNELDEFFGSISKTDFCELPAVPTLHTLEKVIPRSKEKNNKCLRKKACDEIERGNAKKISQNWLVYVYR